MPSPIVSDQPVILGFDPGRDKCGVAIMGVDRTLYHHEVVLASHIVATVEKLQQRFPISLVVMGDQTMSRAWKQTLRDDLVEPLRVVMVDERNSTLEARDRYWKMYPPKGIVRFLPQSLRRIPNPIDDIVAILLIERYLARLATP